MRLERETWVISYWIIWNAAIFIQAINQKEKEVAVQNQVILQSSQRRSEKVILSYMHTYPFQCPIPVHSCDPTINPTSPGTNVIRNGEQV